MIFQNPPRRRLRGAVLNERGQMLAGLLTALAGLLWVCIEAKGGW